MPNLRHQWIDERVGLLREATDEELEVSAATSLPVSDDPRRDEALVDFLVRRDFLERLDRPGRRTRRCVCGACCRRSASGPAPRGARLAAPGRRTNYLEHDRKSLVLEALAAAVPMTPEVAAAFERANEEGYFGFDALLVAKNGSPVALDFFR